MPTPKAGYFLDDGTQCPGCTTVLGTLNTGPLDPLLGWAAALAKSGKDFREERGRSAEVGTAIHDALENYETVPERPLWMSDEEWARMKKAHRDWVSWLAEFQPEIVAQEKQLVSRAYMTGGTFDNILRWKGKTYIGDHKTGKSIDRAKIAAQLAFYGALVQECMGIGIDGALIFHYPPKGKFRVIELGMDDLARGLALFKSARDAYGVLAEIRRAA